MTMGGREAAYREHKDALRARSEAQKHFGIGSAEWIVANSGHSHNAMMAGWARLGLATLRQRAGRRDCGR